MIIYMISNIFDKLGWLSYPQLIQSEAVKLIYRINILAKPRAMVKMFNFDLVGDNVHKVRTPSLIHKPKLAKTQKLQLFRGTYYYSRLPLEIRTSNNISFKRRINKYISSYVNVYHADRPIT